MKQYLLRFSLFRRFPVVERHEKRHFFTVTAASRNAPYAKGLACDLRFTHKFRLERALQV
jgi:hypothetical protein